MTRLPSLLPAAPLLAALLLAGLLLPSCTEARNDADTRAADPATTATHSPTSEDAMPSPATPTRGSQELATFGAGCFWCVEAVLEQLEGVHDVRSGYMGGRVAKPTYEQVCTGTTGHAEVVQVSFDPDVLPYSELLDSFWKLHDPTTLDRQGNDVGTQYRSAIFVHSEAQRQAAEASRAALAASNSLGSPIVTEITAASTFYPAEEYHQDYYRQNKQQSYCRFVIAPKLDKLGLEK